MTNPSTEDKQEVGLLPCDESLTSPRPWQLKSGGDIVDARGHVILKVWNGWNNAALAVNTVNSHAALEAENKALRQEVSFAVSNGHKWDLSDWANWIKNHAQPALGESK